MSYEVLPYLSEPVFTSFPSNLAAPALLYGMDPAPIDQCRVLELGCASGGNLLPMAVMLPHSKFVGIDLSPRQIADGQALLDRLQLPNVELKAMSITDLDASAGTFDYIIAHGVFSWVPREVQDKILDVCRENLAPHGVAYISYNTMPGWHRRQMMREMMMFHVRQFSDPKVKAEQARALLEFLAHSVPDKETNFARTLQEEVVKLRTHVDEYIFHDYLEDVNQPFYFYEFIERAEAKQLQYLGESCFNVNADDLPAEAQGTLRLLSQNRVNFEQYVDFLKNRTFRRTLLVHEAIALDRKPPPFRVTLFQIVGLARPLSARPNLAGGAPESFKSEQGFVTTDIPFIKALLIILYEQWPHPMTFETLAGAVLERLGLTPSPTLTELTPTMLAEALLELYDSNLVALHTLLPRFARAISERPLASPLARLQAAAGARVFNLRHRVMELNELDRAVVQHLDGAHDRAALVERLAAEVAERKLVLHADDEPVRDVARAREVLTRQLEPSLGRILTSALLLS
jgi:methyltransferase-like protein/SAM-dependent methyltransferase